MAQMYTVYINNKEIIFCNKTFANANKNKIIHINIFTNIRKIISSLETDEKEEKIFFVSPFPSLTFFLFRLGYKNVIAAGGLITDENGRILLIFKRGKWDFPKGKVDKGEKISQAALRETKEETGLEKLCIIRKLAVTRHTYEMNGKKILKKTIWFEIRTQNHQELIPQTEEYITDIRWFAPSQLDEIYNNCYASVRFLLNYFLETRNKS